MAVFNDAEIASRLGDLPDWKHEDGQITRTFSFDTFLDGIEFVNNVAQAAESADHHPDIDIRYSNIKVGLSSHDVGGITDRDFNLAAEISRLA